MSRRATTVAVVGAGRLARALAPAWARTGRFRVVVAARRAAAARAVAARHPAIATRPVAEAVAGAGIVVLAVPDAAVAPLARALAPLRRSWRGVTALHAAGAFGPGLLAPLARRGAATGVLHPLAVLGRGASAALSGARARIEGSPAAVAAASALARSAGLRPLTAGRLASPAGRAAYHAAASLAANDVLALLDAAAALLSRAGLPRREAERALAALAGGVAAQVAAHGTAGALTGPASRGDAPTLARHRAALLAGDPEVAEVHRLLSRRLLDLAAREGRLHPARAAEVARSLARGRRGGRAV